MSRSDKVLAQFLRNPGGIAFRDMVTILRRHGFVKIHSRGSHLKFKHSLLSRDLIIPVHNNECKEFYKKHARELIIRLTTKS